MPNPPDWIKWRHAKARDILVEDLQPGGVLFGRDRLHAGEIWSFYSQLDAFEKVPFDQFEYQLDEHRKQARNLTGLSSRDYEAYLHDISLHTRGVRTTAGKIIFSRHPAKQLLRDDIQAGTHTRMPPSEMWSTRPEYQDFSKKEFKERIYQEVRRNKFINHLEMKRLERQKKLGGERTEIEFANRWSYLNHSS